MRYCWWRKRIDTEFRSFHAGSRRPIDISRMSSSSSTSLLSTNFVMLAASGILFQNACKARSKFSTWSNGTSPEDGRGRTRRLPKCLQTKCECFASCALNAKYHGTCFCDRHCRLFADCCADYADEPGSSQLPLPPESFTCSPSSFESFKADFLRHHGVSGKLLGLVRGGCLSTWFRERTIVQ